MRKTVLLAMLGVLCLTGRQTEAAVITVGDFSAPAGTSSFDIPVMISDGENMANARVLFSVGDGGSFLGGSESITIESVDHLTGTLWGGNVTIFPSTPTTPSASTIAQAALNVPGNVPANGLLMTFTLDLTTATAGEVLLLNPNALNPVTGLPFTRLRDVANDNLSLTFDAGTLTITGAAAIPEPSSLVLFAIGVVGIAGHRWRRKRQTAA